MAVPFFELSRAHAELAGELAQAWQQTLSTSVFIGGPAVEEFEASWADYCGTRHCVGVASGTAALELTLAALGIGPGDEVVVPASTFFATAAAVKTVGATPVFVDVHPATLLMTADGLRAALSPRTAAAIVVHLYGQPADMDGIGAVAAAAGIAVIEDAAQAHGARWRGRRAGGLGHAGCFSFYPGKNLGAFGDAGAVVTDDAQLVDAIRSLANHGRTTGSHYAHERIGGNHRLDALQAAILSVKLRRLDAWNAARERAVRWYRTALRDLPVQPIEVVAAASSSNHLFVIQTPRRAELRQMLAERGVATGIHYPIPCHKQPALDRGAAPRLPVAERAAERVLSLPLHPHLTEAELAEVVAALAGSLDALADTLAVEDA
jgi:dTDP-4-amino-4,6-dideoxygalactose transaminase